MQTPEALTSESLISVAVLGKMLFGLIIVLGIMGILILLARFLQRQKLSLTGATNNLKVIQTSHLGPKQKLAVLTWGESQYLVGLTPSGGFLIDKKPLETKSEIKNKPTTQQKSALKNV